MTDVVRTTENPGWMARFSQKMVLFAERWFPDAYVFVLLAVVLVAGAALAHGSSALAISQAFGDGFWNLIPFTMQMALVAIGGYVVAMSLPLPPRSNGWRNFQNRARGNRICRRSVDPSFAHKLGR